MGSDFPCSLYLRLIGSVIFELSYAIYMNMTRHIEVVLMLNKEKL